MNKIITLTGLALLTACSAPGTGGGGGGGGSTSDIPAVLSQNLESAVYNPTAQTLTVQLTSLDAAPLTASYTRKAALDVPGFEAYETQFSGQNRHFIALFAQNPRANAMAGVVADGGQFVNYFGGGIYARVDVFTRPTAGLAVYNGSYAGVLNTGISPGPLDPAAPIRTAGTARITADFNAGGSMSGGITGRTNVDTGVALDNVFMDAAAIDGNGAFAGNVMFGDRTIIGNFGGLFAGTGATDVAGVLVFRPIAGNTDLIEHGAFVLPCTPAQSSITCP